MADRRKSTEATRRTLTRNNDSLETFFVGRCVHRTFNDHLRHRRYDPVAGFSQDQVVY